MYRVPIVATAVKAAEGNKQTERLEDKSTRAKITDEKLLAVNNAIKEGGSDGEAAEVAQGGEHRVDFSERYTTEDESSSRRRRDSKNKQKEESAK